MEKAIFTNMCMIYDDQGRILVQNRVKKDWSGLAFPGGHVEAFESFTDSVIREVKEETGLDIKNPCLCGVKQWPTKDGARYVVFYFKTKQFSGELKSSEEGEVFWIQREELQNYRLAQDFDEMIKVFESDLLSEQYYYIEDGKWKMKSLPE